MPTPKPATPATPAVVDALERRDLFATLVAGQSVQTGIRTAGVQKNWTIPLVAGQAVVVAAGDTGAAFATELILIAPTGKAIARSVGGTGGFIGKTAPVSGNYVVRVRDVGGNDTASVNVTAFFTGNATIADGDDAFVAESGRRRPATIGPGDLDVWTINATSGQFLSVQASENDVGLPIGVGVLLVGPDGRGVTSAESDTGVKIDRPSAGVVTGTYYAVVYEPGANATGRYGISFARTPGPQYAGDPDTVDPLVSGTPRNGDMASGDIDLFQVPLGRGDTTTITLTQTTGGLNPEVVLIDPAGRVVADADGAGTATLTYTATASGTYSVLTRDRESDTGGMYTLTYTRS